MHVPQELNSGTSITSKFDCFMEDISVSPASNNDVTKLSLNNEQKTANIFAADQTPTPTCLIKNCEEVGLFEDLRHVNPFEETFRRAVEQQTGQTPTALSDVNEDSLHTPQVFPQLDTNVADAFNCVGGDDSLLKTPLTASATLDVPAVDSYLVESSDTSAYKASCRQVSNDIITATTYLQAHGTHKSHHKYRNIAEKSLTIVDNCGNNACLPFVQLHATNANQMLQPQLLTLSFHGSANTDLSNKPTKLLSAAIPVQTVKPFILPKLTTSTKEHNEQLANAISTPFPPTTPHEPSSASLTPTSQLPIKERLKAILSNSHKTRNVEVLPHRTHSQRPRNSSGKSHPRHNDDCMERRRAASTRYRHKMRNEHKELRKRNLELQADNERLRERIRLLEQEVAKRQNGSLLCVSSDTRDATNTAAQIQIPSSTIHLVMNIPQLLVPTGGAQNPITYSVQKSL